MAQNFSMSALMSPVPPITSMNFFLSGASFIAICNFNTNLIEVGEKDNIFHENVSNVQEERYK